MQIETSIKRDSIDSERDGRTGGGMREGEEEKRTMTRNQARRGA
jgi:hypothetical protein